VTIVLFLHFLCAALYLQLIFYVLYKDPASLLNRVCALTCACFAIWTFGDIIMNDPRSSDVAASLAHKIDSIGWISFAPLFLWFSMVFTGRGAILRKKIFLPLLFLPSPILIFQQWAGAIVVGYIATPYGKSYLYDHSAWPYIFFAYLGACMIVAFILLGDYIGRVKEKIRRRQAFVLLFTSAFAFMTGSIDSFILPMRGIHLLPSLAHLYAIIWIAGLVYAIKKYEFLATPAAAGDKIIGAMFEMVFLLDIGGNIIIANPSAERVLGYAPGGLLGLSFDRIAGDKGFVEQLLAATVRGESSKARETTCATKNGEVFSATVSYTALRNSVGDVVGTVCVARVS